MKRKELLKFSLISLTVGIIVLVIAFFFFHFVTDDGITLIWHKEAGKPFVTFLIGVLGVLFVFTGAISFIAALVFTEKTNK
ncbi:MAG: hypothetical protein IJW38_05265 [Clostridia bacterium]|nr:hypothetical protein [Clostridia bacterium]